ncbi:family 2 glycosyl transferase [Brevibacillus agri BAB-2500]|nr:family 2 glycosyl transferase [Brevibacillus agri BAB-2500]
MIILIFIGIFVFFQIVTVFFSTYHGIISFFGLLPVEKRRLHQPEKKIAVVVAAHNEEQVVEEIIESLKNQNYPNDLYSIMVICDNCTDGTANVVRNSGALAFERFDKDKRGKGYALEWMFEKIYNMEDQFDAIVVFDADNVASSNFLLHMNDHLCRGHKIIQGYLDSKNPDDSWVTMSYAIAYWFMGRMWQQARYRLGLPNALGGTGMCFDINVLKELGWGATSLTEDLEFTMKAVLNNIRPVWAHHAKVYDEKPLEFKASWNQRLRWMQGHWDVAFRYTIPLFKKFIKDRDLKSLDCVMYLLQPSRILLAYYTLFMNLVIFILPMLLDYLPWWMKLGQLFPTYVWVLLFVLQWLFPPVIAVVMILERVKLKRLIGLLWYQIFGISWLPLTLIAFFTRKNTVWSHTVHTRKISVNSIEINN